MSSHTARTGILGRWNPLYPSCFSSFLSSGLMKIMNKRGERMSPCLTPTLIGILSVRPVGVMTCIFMFLYIAMIISMNSVGAP